MSRPQSSSIWRAQLQKAFLGKRAFILGVFPVRTGSIDMVYYPLGQVCDSNKVRRNKAGVPIEADVSTHLAHPNLVRTIDTATAYREPLQKLDWEVKQDAAAEGASPSSQQFSKAESPTASPAKSQSNDAPVEETWLLLEYCDQGSFVVRASQEVSCCVLSKDMRFASASSCCSSPHTAHAAAKVSMHACVKGGNLWHAGCCGGGLVPGNARWDSKFDAGAVHCWRDCLGHGSFALARDRPRRPQLRCFRHFQTCAGCLASWPVKSCPLVWAIAVPTPWRVYHAAPSWLLHPLPFAAGCVTRLCSNYTARLVLHGFLPEMLVNKQMFSLLQRVQAPLLYCAVDSIKASALGCRQCPADIKRDQPAWLLRKGVGLWAGARHGGGQPCGD